MSGRGLGQWSSRPPRPRLVGRPATAPVLVCPGLVLLVEKKKKEKKLPRCRRQPWSCVWERTWNRPWSTCASAWCSRRGATAKHPPRGDVQRAYHAPRPLSLGEPDGCHDHVGNLRWFTSLFLAWVGAAGGIEDRGGARRWVLVQEEDEKKEEVIGSRARCRQGAAW